MERKVLAQFSTNSFVGNPLSTIAMATAAGMGLMFATISIGAPIWISMAALFAGILLVYGNMVGDVRYTLYEDHIEQEIKKFIPYYLSKKIQVREIFWKDVKSFKNDFDYSRSQEEYEYIKLYLKKSPGEIWITNQKNKQGFEDFKDQFMSLMKPKIKPKTQVVEASSASEVKVAPQPVKSAPTQHIKQLPSFYNTWFAKFLTAFFALLTIGIFVYSQINGWKFTHLVRFEAVLLPGTIYMIYRVFVRDKN